MEFNESEFLIESFIPTNELIYSSTDLSGKIIDLNEAFAKISGYEKEELIGKSHSIVRHPDMPKRVFKQMWEDLILVGTWEGVIKNLRKDRGYYWVHAIVSAVYEKGVLVGYKSIRVPIDYQTKIKYQKLYDEYRNVDKDNIRRVIYS